LTSSSINPNIFREFSIRGIAEQDLPNNVVKTIGQAIGVFFAQQAKTSIIVGRDARISSPRISRALIEGLIQAGIMVTDIGQVPTPVLNFTVDSNAADGGIMITASHNPPAYNGLKIRTTDTLHGAELQTIYRLTTTKMPEAAATKGRVIKLDPFPTYLDRLKSRANIRPLNVVVDGGNGTNGLIVSGLLREFGCSVTELYCDPDGNFPNRSPDPTAAGATDDLAAAVRRTGANLGLAYDGDGDRLVIVDEQGKRVLGDQIMMLLARNILQHKQAKIVYEILCTQALADDVIAHGGEPVMTPSGYAFVHRAMQETGAALGGELSGHLFFNDPDFRFDDAILGTVKLLGVLSNNRQPLSALAADLPTYYSSPELRIPCPDEAKKQVVTYVKTHFEKDYRVDTLDGARIHFENGWALVRQSNTQPIISMRFEAHSAAQLAAIQNRVQPLVKAKINRLAQEDKK